MQNIAIIGAGASGLFCASLLNSPKVSLFETSLNPAKKLFVSGGGKCNITNKHLSSSFYQGDNEFINQCFNKFDNQDLLLFLKQNNILYKLLPKIVPGTYFLQSSSDIIEILLSKSKQCEYCLNNNVIDIAYKNDSFYIYTKKQTFQAKNLIVASGGLSYPSLGSSDIGYKIATTFSHSIETLNPALVGFTVQKEQFWFKTLSGLSLNASIKTQSKILNGSLLFTHKGISGPAILSSSLYWEKGQLEIDFMPAKSIHNFKNCKQALSNALPLPKRFIKAFLKQLNLNDGPYSSYTNEQIQKLNTLHHYTFAPAGTFGYSKAEVTKGGVKVDELDANFQSKKQKGLFFVGEVLDITGELGGYNLQWAFTSAYIAATYIQKHLIH